MARTGHRASDRSAAGTGAPAMTSPGCQCRALEGPRDLLSLHVAQPHRYPFLLESSGGSPSLGRFDVLCAFPGRELSLRPDWVLQGQAPGESPTSDFLAALNAAMAAGAPSAPGGLPFRGGWFVFLAYEMACQAEPSLALPTDPRVPLAKAVRIPAAVIRDRATGQTWAVAEPGSAGLLEQIEADAKHALALPRGLPGVSLRHGLQEDDPAAFTAAVGRVQRHIAAGDVYQANISRRWSGEVGADVEPWMVYARLRAANPAPFGGLALLDAQTAIVSSSPERLLRVASGRVETRPIAGTRPRSIPARSDADLRASLLASDKERAEHVMLIDLERNDLGRVCKPGSVRVDDFMSVETYAHVHHIVSGVSGELRAGVAPGDVLRAVFPGGTITGCPKVRCIRLIGELETSPRGVYTGAMGYLNHDGSCDFNILIRTMTLCGRQLSFSAGSGIVADSDPELELAETRAKAKGLVLALRA
jgi:anthranilate synthase component I